MEDDEFKLHIEDAEILLSYIAGDAHLIDINKFNNIIENMQMFVDDFHELYDCEE